MKPRRRALLLLLAIAAVLGLAWLTRARWLSGLLSSLTANAGIIQVIDSLISIGGILVPAAIALLVLLGFIRRQAPQAPPPLVRPISLDALRQPFANWPVDWIDRGVTAPDDLTRSPRLLITGASKMGKSREAVELIGRALPLCRVDPTRIYEPTDQLRGVEPGLIAGQLVRDIPTTDELLLWLDDLPRKFQGDELDRLTAALNILDRRPYKALYVVATARDDQLDGRHEDWLGAQGFKTIALQPLKSEQISDLVVNAADRLGVRLDEGAREEMVQGSDGSPELTRLTFLSLNLAGVDTADRATVIRFQEASVELKWLDLRRDLIRNFPESEHLLWAMALFYTSRVTSYTDLVLSLAARKMHGVARVWRLSTLLPRLEVYSIRENDDRLQFPDYVAEAEETGSEELPAAEIARFLLSHRRWLRLPGIRSLYRSRERHTEAILDLAQATAIKQDVDLRFRLYSVALGFRPNMGYYVYDRPNIVGETDDAPDRKANALVDYYSEAIRKGGRLKFLQSYKLANRGQLHASYGRVAEALADYDKAIQLFEDESRFYHLRGTLHLYCGREAEALADFNQAIQRGSFLVPVVRVSFPLALGFLAPYFASRGWLHATHGRPAEALADYDEAISLGPGHAITFFYRGHLHADHGRPSEALADYTEVIRLYPNHPLAYYYKGVLLRLLGRVEESQSDLEVVAGYLTLFRDLSTRTRRSEYATYNHACLEAVTGDHDLALELLERVLKKGAIHPHYVRRDPDWRSLRDDPRFRRLLDD